MKIPIVRENISISQSMKKLSETGQKCLIVIDKKKKLIGTLTDGDIRRNIILGYELSDSIIKIYNKSPIYFFKNNFSLENAKKIFISKNISLIPIINKNRNVIDCLTWDGIFKNIFKKNYLQSLNAVIMAGGKGYRMKPFTDVLPKALIPVHNKPIIDHIIQNFTNFGISKFFLTINNKNKILKYYFKDKILKDYKINFIVEKKPLGTVGGIKLLSKKLSKDFFLANCDILVDVNYEDVYKFHKKKENDVTIIVSIKEFNIPYGVCEIDRNGILKSIREKPNYEHLVNTGLYVINRNIIQLIPKNKYFDFTDLIKILQKKKKKIGVFPVMDQKWIDVGQWDIFEKSISKIKE